MSKPNASSVNFIAGRSVANFAAIRTDGRGDFCVWTTTDTHILWDQVSETTALTTPPLRKIDTAHPARENSPAEEVLKIATGAPGGSTVLGNLTVTQPASDGHVRAYPCDLDKPNASSLNFAAGRSVANFAAIRNRRLRKFLRLDHDRHPHPVGPGVRDHRVDHPRPLRKIDTRAPGKENSPAEEVLKIATGAPGGSTVLGNLTVTQPASDGHVRAYPCDLDKPNASSLNFAAGRSVANFAAIRTDASGSFCVWTTTDTHILWDQVSETTAVTTPPRTASSIHGRTSPPWGIGSCRCARGNGRFFDVAVAARSDHSHAATHARRRPPPHLLLTVRQFPGLQTPHATLA